MLTALLSSRRMPCLQAIAIFPFPYVFEQHIFFFLPTKTSSTPSPFFLKGFFFFFLIQILAARFPEIDMSPPPPSTPRLDKFTPQNLTHHFSPVLRLKTPIGFAPVRTSFFSQVLLPRPVSIPETLPPATVTAPFIEFFHFSFCNLLI